MSLFYDPVKRRPQIWVVIGFIVIPILGIILFLFMGRRFVEQKQKQDIQGKPVDIFDRI